mgnify:CR=1 FL=1
MALTNHKLSGAPTKPVKIDGKTYDLQLGNFTLLISVKEWVSKMQALDVEDENHLFEQIGDLANDALDIVASVLGDAAAEELVGGKNRLNLYRIIDVLNILAEEMSSDDSLKTVTSAIEFKNKTIDE